MVSRNNRKKGVPCQCFDGQVVKHPTKCLWRYARLKVQLLRFQSKRGSKGGGGLFLPYCYQFFSGSLRSPVLYKHISRIHTSKLNVQYGTVFLSLYFPYTKYEKKIQLSIPCFYERAFSYFYTILHHLSKNFSEGGPPHPSWTHLQYKNYHVISLCVERGACY